MEDHRQPANVEEPEQAQDLEDPPQPVNVEDQQPPVNGYDLPLPHGADDHQFLFAPNQIQLLDFENHLVDVDNLAELMNRHDEPPMNLDEIRQLLDVIDIVDVEEDEANAPNDPEKWNPFNEETGEHHHDDSDEELDFEALAAIIYLGMMKKN